MEKHFELNDLQFENQFERATLDPKIFSHEAHLRLAWIHLKKYGLEKAEKNIEIQLRNFVAQVGAEDKYHQTVTLAAVKMVHHFMRRSESECFPQFIAEFPQLKLKFKQLMACHYSFDVFGSEKAKKEFIVPDKVGFD